MCYNENCFIDNRLREASENLSEILDDSSITGDEERRSVKKE